MDIYVFSYYTGISVPQLIVQANPNNLISLLKLCKKLYMLGKKKNLN